MTHKSMEVTPHLRDTSRVIRIERKVIKLLKDDGKM